MFRSKAKETSKVISSREIMSKITNLSQDLNKNKLPKISPGNIYEIGTFDFKTVYSIKKHEETLSLQNEFEEIKLLNQIALEEYRQKGFNYIHFGLIQIAIKPLSKLGIDSPVLLLLRDKTVLKFQDSLLGAVQSNLCNGAVYFNCAPNFQVSLHDPTILNTLVLNVHLPETVFQQHRHGYLLLYRIYFKHTTSEFNPRCLLHDTKGETTILTVESEDENTPVSTYTPKLLNWHEITVPDMWKIENPQPPRNLAQTEISQIIEEPDGRVLLRFNSLNLNNTSIKSNYSDTQSSRSSFSYPSSFKPENFKGFNQSSKPESSTSSTPYKVNYTSPIAEPLNQSPPSSPTQSKFQINMIQNDDFDINKDFLRKDIYKPENDSKRE